MTEPAKDEAELVEVMAKAHRECWRDREGLRVATRDWPDITVAQHLDCIAQMEAALAAIRAAGWVVVPVEPTDEMRSAINRADWSSDTDLHWSDGYRIMIAAAPGGEVKP